MSVALLAGCGGSDKEEAPTAPVPEDPAVVETVSVGGVAGFSSKWVLVNDVRFDKQTTEVLNDDDDAVDASELKLGMQVEVESAGINRAKGVGRAARIAFGSAILGKVEAVDVAAKEIKVLGQTIQVSDGTVFDKDITGGLAGVTVGSVIDVHGLLDAATGATAATRVELRAANSRFFRLRGVVSELNDTAKTMRVGGQLMKFADVPARQLQRVALADGKVVRAVMAAEQVDGQFVARRLEKDRRFVADGNAVDIQSIVTQFTSKESFKLFGLLVDAKAATFVNEASLKRGAKVKTQGKLTAGVLVASNVEVKVRGQKDGVQLEGTAATVDAAAKTFKLNDLTIDFSGEVTFVGGDAAALVDGVKVSVKGKVSADGTRVTAQRIEILPAN